MCYLRLALLGSLLLIISCGGDATAPTIVEDPPTFVLQWGGVGNDPGEFYQPTGVAIGPDSTVYVSDAQNYRIQRFTRSGDFLGQRSLRELSEYYPPFPLAIAAGSKGLIYVRVMGIGVVKLSPDLEYIGRLAHASWGRNAMAVDGSGNLYVAGIGREAPWEGEAVVWKLSPEDEELAAWRVPLSRDASGWRPQGIAVDRDQNVYVSAQEIGTIRDSVWKFEPDGGLVAKWSFRWKRGERGIAVDSKGNLYSVDSVEGRVYKFDSRGRMVAYWSEVSPNHEPLDMPLDIAVDQEDFIYVADWSHHRIVKSRYE
jgi:streptogramin lyase